MSNMPVYNPQKIEKKWQKIWEKKSDYKAKDFSKQEKSFLLVEFPYPSGAGLHVGHCRSYVGMDIIARKKRMQGVNVMFPMGWDAFGLPTENYAIKTGVHPTIATKINTKKFKQQMNALGLSFDWSREVNTTDPQYYKWTQWIFVQLFKNGLAYKSKMPINWCPCCKIGLANEEVVEGKCERCGAIAIKKEKEQWLVKITKYADRLIKDLDKIDYPERVKTLQKDWIGRSEGNEVSFNVKCQMSNIKTICQKSKIINVFTTRLDTLFGCTYLVIAPEHSALKELGPWIKNIEEVKQYVKHTKSKSDLKRIENREKTGVKLERISAINPATGKEIPIFVADYVLPNYGTGAIMAVPAHDDRDYEFAKKFNLPIIKTISGEQALKLLAKKSIGKKKINYKLRDWVFSRQHYWGEPIPMINCKKCGWVVAPEKDLPIELPAVTKYQPSDSGESPLANIKKWVNVKCPKCKGQAKRETDTMPNWAGSNWYFLRYCDPKNNKCLASPKKLEYWMALARRSPKGVGGVDWYNGGMEHTTLHLLYSRFIFKFLWDIGSVPKSIGTEPYKKRTSHGMILAEGGVKMSKSKGNVINPDEVIRIHGADSLRLYEMFMGPFEQAIAWDTNGLRGIKRFLQKVWQLFGKSKCQMSIIAKQLQGAKRLVLNQIQMSNVKCQNARLERLLHKTIKKVGEDIESLKFNTAVSALMILVNEMEKEKEISIIHYSLFLILLAPFAPHLCEELYQKVKAQSSKVKTTTQKSKLLMCESIFEEKWPEYNPKLIHEKIATLIIQINGKFRDKIEVESGILKDDVKEIALLRPNVKKWIEGKEIKKIIFVPDKLLNFVIE